MTHPRWRALARCRGMSDAAIRWHVREYRREVSSWCSRYYRSGRTMATAMATLAEMEDER